jgi:hypothetical protein
LVWVTSCWSVCMSITAKDPSYASPSTHHPMSRQQSLNPTTLSCPLTLCSSKPMSLLCLTTRPFTISTEGISISNDPTTLTSTSLRSGHLIPDRLSEVQRCLDRRYHRIPDQPCALPKNSLYVIIVRPNYLWREGLLRAAVRL